MAEYKIIFHREAQKFLDKIPVRELPRILKRIDELSKNPRPHNCAKLSDGISYRVRQGDYRIIYTIEDKNLIVLILDVDNRKDAYRKK